METEFAQYLNSGVSRSDFELLLEELAKQEAIRQASYPQELQGSPEMPSGLQTMVAALGPRNAEAARTARIIEPMSPSVTAQRDAQTAKIMQDMKIKEEEAQLKNDALKQRLDTANNQSSLRNELFATNLAAQPSSGGQSRAYSVPPELQEKFGQHYLTNAILPQRGAPVVPKSYGNPADEQVENGMLTDPTKVDWQRVEEGNYERKYSTGKPAPAPTRQQQIVQAVAAGIPAEQIKLMFGEEKGKKISRQATINKQGKRVWAYDDATPSDAPVASTIPSGFRETEDGEIEPVPGGPQDIKYHQAKASDQSSFRGLNEGLERMKYTAKQLLNENKGGVENISGKSQYLPIWGGTATFPGTAGANAKARLETLKAKVGFEVLQQMRNNSKTGGALGQVSDMENKLLQQAIDSLDTSQSDEQVLSAIQKVYDTADRIQKQYESAYQRKWGDYDKKQSASQPQGNKPDPLGIR